MSDQFASYVQGAAVGALAILLAAKVRRSMAWHRRGSHENTAPDSSTQRPRLWHDCVPVPKPLNPRRQAALLAWKAERQRCIDLGLNPPPPPDFFLIGYW
jgi:hypothetical protein